MGGYLENSRWVLLSEARQRLSAAKQRAERFHSAHGDVGCYPDLIAAVALMERVVAAIETDHT